MAVDVEELIINPFKEVVERGNEALANAEAAQQDDPELARQMHKAAQAVVREGERALKRIQPLWDAHVDKYGDDFKESIRDNDEISEKRRTLEDMLYDFEDFIEDSSFEVEKFTELQAATKSLALDTLDIIKRLKIDKPTLMPTPTTSAAPSPAVHSFPPLPPLPPMRSGTQSSRASRPNTLGAGGDSPTESVPSLSHFPHPPTTPSAPTPGEQFVLNGAGARSSTGSRNNRMSGLQRAASSRASSVYSADGQPIQPRRVETWSASAVPRQQQAEAPRPQLHRQPSTETHLLSPQGRLGQGFPERRPSSPSVLGDEIERVRITGEPDKPTSPQRMVPQAANGVLPRTSAWVSEQNGAPQQQRHRPRPRGESIPEDAAVLGTASRVTIEPVLVQGRATGNGSIGSQFQHHQHHNHQFQHGQQHPQHQQHHEYQPYTHNGPVPSFLADPTSPATTHRTSLFSDTNTASTAASGHFMLPSSGTRSSSLGAFGFEKETGGLATLPPVGEHDDGLMLAGEVAMSETSGTQVLSSSTAAREADCMIGAKSSFHQLKGFCDGAEAFRKSNHSQGVKQANAYGESVVVGRCTSCEYYNIYSEVTLDLAKDSRANFMKSNVLYRIRFVFKSHIVARNASEARYACLFCTQTGHTVREGDATVFQTLDALMRHLSRHPQPLPEVPGVTVLYGRVEEGNMLEEDYDLHFPDPPAPSPVPDRAFSTLPSATAIKSHIRKQGEKALVDPDGSEDVLKFLVGARIVGVEFPDKWGGKWCIGWHDGVRSAFPAKVVEVEGPKQSEISLQSSSAVSVTAKWKWAPKDAGRAGWLSFDKGDTIKNVGWLYQEHWCWTGMNSKGKFGVFPSSHVDHLSIKEIHEVKRPTTSKGGLFGLRRKSISTESSYS